MERVDGRVEDGLVFGGSTRALRRRLHTQAVALTFHTPSQRAWGVRCALVVLCGAPLLLTPAAQAQPNADTLERLAQQSVLVVVGTVVALTPQAGGPSGQPGIHTRVDLAVQETIAGTPSQNVTFWVPGGRLGRRMRVVTHQATFATGDHVAVLLTQAAGVLWPSGMARGRCDVRNGGVTITFGGGPSWLSLEDFRSRVSAAWRRRLR